MASAPPYEIVDEILHHLAQDKVALQSCSIVSSAFRVPSQRRLFHSIVLNLGHTVANARLHVILSSNLVLASSIRCLTVSLCENFDARAVCGALQMLKPYELRLDNASSFSLFGTWNRIAGSIRSCLIGLLYAPSCISLTLGDICFPAKYLPKVPHLQHLNLSCEASVILDEPFPPPADDKLSEREGYLATVTLGSYTTSQRLLNTLHDPSQPSLLSLSRLRKIKATNQASADIQILFNLSAPHLEEVDVDVNLYLSEEYLDLSLLSSLRVLRIHIRSGLRGQPGTWILRVLSTLPPLSELEITMHSGLGFRLNASEWQKLDVLLAHKCHAGTLLRRVVFGFDGHSEATGRWFLTTRLPKLAEIGLLEVRSCAERAVS